MNEKKTLIAIAITATFLLIYPFILQKLGLMTKPSPTVTRATPAPESTTTLSVPSDEWQISSPAQLATIEQQWLKLMVSDVTGSIIEAHLQRYQDLSDHQPLRFFWSQGIGLGWVGDQPAPLQQPLKPLTLKDFSGEKGVVQRSFPSGIELTQAYLLRKDQPAFEVILEWENPTSQPQKIQPTIWMSGQTIDLVHHEDIRLVEVNALHQDGKLDRRYVHKLGDSASPSRVKGALSWCGLKGKYFSIVMAPLQGTTAQELLSYRASQGEIRLGLVLAPHEIPAQGRVQQSLVVYVGPNNSEVLAGVHRGMEKLVASGVLAAIGQILLGILNAIHTVVRNYGIAIILLTLMVNLFLLPLTAKSLKSMKELQKLQPKMNKLREVYKNNAEKLNQEMLKLYREHKVNPLGGCLPMVLQMPIFIALYQTLVRSIELRGADFLWIKDLSAPDALWRISGGIPLIGNSINLLPILMMVAMVIQQRLSTKLNPVTTGPNDPQKMMATVMPILFGVLFYQLPSGLVLYWLTNTVIMTAYQFQLMRAS